MKGGQSLLSLRIRKIDGYVSAGRDDVELWVKHVDAVDDPIEPRKSEGGVALILSDGVLAANLIPEDKKRRPTGSLPLPRNHGTI